MEGLVRPAPWPGSMQRLHDPSPDFKFFTFGLKIPTVLIILHRKSDRECIMWVDDHFRRQDRHGCTLFDPLTGKYDTFGHTKWKHCSSIPKPPNWSKLVSTARLLGAAVSIHFRVDLFDSAHSGVLLGEFAPFHSNGKIQCVVERTRSGDLDPCILGRAWKEAGFKGSPLVSNPKAPVEIERYLQLRNWSMFYKMLPKAQHYLRGLAMRALAVQGSAAVSLGDLIPGNITHGSISPG